MSEISDGEILYRYAKPGAFPQDQAEIPTAIFNDPEMSCDWAYYQTVPEQSFNIQHGRSVIIEITVCDEIRNPTNPKRAGEIVADWKQEIFHDPVELKADDPFTPNKSHSLIKGKKRGPVLASIREHSRKRN